MHDLTKADLRIYDAIKPRVFSYW